MDKSNYLEKLLEGVEVEWKSLGEITTFINGKGHEKEIDPNGRFIVVNSKFISTNGKNAKYSNNQLCPLYIDDILIVMSDLPNGKALAKTFIVNRNNTYTLNQRIGCIRINDFEILNPKFIYFLLNRIKQLTKFDNGTDQTNLRKDQIQSVQIPIPPIEIQNEIVRILDAFTELTTELTLRKNQYNYYRDKLLSFEEDEVEWKSLGEIAVYNKSRISHTELDNETYVGVENLLQNRAGKVNTNYLPTNGNLIEYSKGDILIGNIRPYLKKYGLRKIMVEQMVMFW